MIQIDFGIIYFIYVFNFQPNVHPKQLLHNIMQLSYALRISLDMQTVKVTIDQVPKKKKKNEDVVGNALFCGTRN